MSFDDGAEAVRVFQTELLSPLIRKTLEIIDKQIIECGKENLRMSGCHEPLKNKEDSLHVELQSLHVELYNIRERIINLEESYHGLFQDYNHLENGMVDLRAHGTEDHEERILILENRIKELERFQDITHLEYKAKRKPHKCPVCNGAGLFQYKENNLAINCRSCDGKGIVWG